MFTKKDLQVGMIAEFRNGRIFMVMPIENCIVVINENGGFNKLENYNESFNHKLHKDEDFMKIWNLSECKPLALDFAGRTLLWQREEPKFYVTLPAGTFLEHSRYLNYSSDSQSYFFSSENELRSVQNIKTKFTSEEANKIKQAILASIETVEIKGE